MIVTIDGPAGAGKSTIARGLAERLEFDFLDTGAMYRAVTVAALRAGVAGKDQSGVAANYSRICRSPSSRESQRSTVRTSPRRSVLPEVTGRIAEYADEP